MKLLGVCLSFFVLGGCQGKPAQATAPDRAATPGTVVVPGKRDDLAELIRKADALIADANEREAAPPPEPEVFPDPVVVSERVDRAQPGVAPSSRVRNQATARTTTARTTPAPQSSMDTMRAKAEAQFTQRLRALSSRRDKFEASYRRYQEGCSGQFIQPVPSGGMSLDAIIAGGDDALIPSGRLPPPGRTSDPSVANARTPLCRTLLSDIRLERLQIRSEVNGMRETARRDDFFPGIMRDIFARYGLTY